MKDSVSPSFVDLNEFMKNLGYKESDENQDLKKLKLFFEEREDVPEIYLNINEKEHWLELSEKDEMYRGEIIKSLKKD